jgi:hypothetical protein
MLKFEDFGLEFRKPSISQVDMPHDVTLLSSEQLAEKFTALTAWADYIASQLAVSQIEERHALRKMDLAENRLLVSRMGTPSLNCLRPMRISTLIVSW